MQRKILHYSVVFVLFIICSCNQPVDVKQSYNKKYDRIDSLIKKNYDCKIQTKPFSIDFINNEFMFEPSTNAPILFSNRPLSNYLFTNDIQCIDTSFYNEMNFDDTKFSKEVSFNNIKFLSGIHCRSAIFEGPSHFNNSYFAGEFNFYNSKFSSKVDFSDIQVDGDVVFGGASFKEGADFSSASFGKYTSFYSAGMKGDFIFARTHFGNCASFSNLNLNDSTNLIFFQALLPDTIDFSFTSHIANEVDLTTASFTDSQHINSNTSHYRPYYINLYKADISKFHLDYIHFRLQIDSLNNDVYQGEIKVTTDEVLGMYEALLNNFKVRGQLESYKLLDIEYQQYKWKHSSTPFWAIISRYWWNFGYNKEYVFAWTGFFLLLFTLISFFSLGYLIHVYPLEKINEMPEFVNNKFTVKDSFKRMWFAFVYSSVIFFRLTLKVEAINYRKIPGTLYIILMYTVGIICIAYMANYVIQK